MVQKREEGGACRGPETAERMYRFIVQERLIVPGDCVLAGVSGGADSVCMLLLLHRLRERLGFELRAVHVEHGIRGEESRRDAAFAEEFCQGLGVPCEVFCVSVPEYAASCKTGFEEAARELRYDCYRKAALACGGRAVKIALAHHADDNAETVLLWLARGCGPAGLGGMRPARRLFGDVMVIRPLLFARREEILRCLKQEGQAYREDPTNADTDYSRNRIRHRVLPQLKEVNPQAAVHIAKSAELFAELSGYLEAEVERILPAVTRFSGTAGALSDPARSWLIRQELCGEYPAVLQKALVHRVLCDAAGGRDIGSVHVGMVLGLFSHQTGHRISLPCRLEAVRVYEGVRIRGRQAGGRDGTAEECYLITEEELARAESGGESVVLLPDAELRFRVFDREGPRDKPGGRTEETGSGGTQSAKKCEFSKKKYTKWLDYDKIKGSLQIRRRQSGDYLTIDDDGHRKKLREYLIGEKIPADQRDRIWLLAQGAHVIWVTGRRISAGTGIGQDTRRVLEVRMIKREWTSAGCSCMEDDNED